MTASKSPSPSRTRDSIRSSARYDPTELIRLPVAVTAKANGHTWGATFADYRGDLEPNVWMIFPTTIKWTLDGKPLADMKVTFFRSNPYIVFPIPDVVKQKSSN